MSENLSKQDYQDLEKYIHDLEIELKSKQIHNISVQNNTQNTTQKPQVSQQNQKIQVSSNKVSKNNNQYLKPKYYSKKSQPNTQPNKPQKQVTNYFRSKNYSIKEFFQQKKVEKDTKRQEDIAEECSRFPITENSSAMRYQIQKKLNIKVQKKKIEAPTEASVIPKDQAKGEKFPHIFGEFDHQWYYLNKERYRSYQFNITQKCLIQNTLVCLPTGLGKTFIATNVIFNFHQWFPYNIIIFLAPTKPLVAQQKSSLKQVEQIKRDQIHEITGTLQRCKREEVYKQNGIFFMTPQTLHNDIQNGIIDIQKIVLIVYDEAHKAVGKYAYSLINKKLQQKKVNYRVVALSATPGSELKEIQKLLKNLSISCIQVKSEQDQEVSIYLQKKNIYPLFIKDSGEIIALTNAIEDLAWYMMIFIKEKLTLKSEQIHIPKSGRLVNYVTLQPLFGSFRNNLQRYRNVLNDVIINDIFFIFKLLFRLSQTKRFLKNQGVQIFENSLQDMEDQMIQNKGNFSKKLLESDPFKKIKSLIDYYDNRSIETHPKMIILSKILDDFFSCEQVNIQASKVIVFTHNRKNAYQIEKVLKTKIALRPSIFIGQNNTNNTKKDRNSLDDTLLSDQTEYIQLRKDMKKQKKTEENEEHTKGMNQKLQIETLEKFKANEYNVLIATCVAEEGLDIGEVDLIICYDSGLSPIRLVQRMGRTGRKRNGSCILLLNKSEHMQYGKSQKTCKQIIEILKQESSLKKLEFFKDSPRMIPNTIEKLNLKWIESKEEKNKKNEQIDQQDVAIDELIYCIVNRYKESKQIIIKKIKIKKFIIQDFSYSMNHKPPLEFLLIFIFLLNQNPFFYYSFFQNLFVFKQLPLIDFNLFQSDLIDSFIIKNSFHYFLHNLLF